MHIDALLAALGNGGPTEPTTGGTLVRCPAHTDSRPSLLVSLKADGMALVHCRAGCKTAAVLAASGLTEAQLYRVTGTPTATAPDPAADLGPGAIAALTVYVEAAAARFPGSLAADYAYRRFGVTEDLARDLHLGFDAGQLEFAARDFRPNGFKSFPRLVVPFLGRDGVARGLQGRDVTDRCPSRWVNLGNPPGARWATVGVLRTSSSFETVIVTEGPGDGLSAASTGYTAMFVRGAGLARSARTAREIAEAAGDSAEIILAGDNDRGGVEFTDGLGAELVALGRAPRVLGFPAEHKDLTVWRGVDPAGFPQALHEAVGNAQLWKPREPEEGTSGPRARGPVKPMQGTDLENARMALLIVGADTAFVEGVGFLCWTGKVWEAMPRSLENSIGHRVAIVLERELEAMPRGDKQGSRVEQRQAQEYTTAKRTATRMHMDNGIRAALDHLRTITHRRIGEFDRHRHLLTFRNGTVDLRTGALTPHDREQRLTKLVDLDYLPDAPAPRWERFLGEVFADDPDMPAYLRRLIGYGITGETAEHAFGLLHGHGANGKSVFVNTIAEVFEGITGHIAQSAVAYQRSFDPGAANPALAGLRGLRLAMLSELPEGMRLNEALLKQLTAGDPVTARELYKGHVTFSPSALILMATNHRPDVRGQDDGFWRRTRLIPFRRSFGPGERDPLLSRKLAEEATGIAAWAVRGATEWYTGGLADPDTVSSAVAEYRQQSDLLDGYLPGVLVPDPSGSILLKDAFAAFEDWRDAEQVEQVAKWGNRTLLRHLESRRVAATRTKQGKTLLGIRRARPGE
ncbi:putative DNA primase/helicase [Actinokineospora baliensis]|uniref:phage/plasmid primase, P4 family n=1 Tax=Actinokineospora baliensis TaxID=547056 RepID=UPI0019563888|nr:phage/plasmid primase, P4 family [Actinokineospora baliensis]MBM7770612.1 putative DNA primase/helicase [Actinokineospora baliensis]